MGWDAHKVSEGVGPGVKSGRAEQRGLISFPLVTMSGFSAEPLCKVVSAPFLIHFDSPHSALPGRPRARERYFRRV